jgi:pilus assembly protein CpaB
VKTRLLTITLAAVLALVGVTAVLAYVRQANERALNGLKAEAVLAATGTIPAGTSLSQAWKGNLLHAEDVPVSSVTGAGPVVPRVTTANGSMVIASTMTKGQLLLQNILAPAGTSTPNGNTLAIPQNMFAMSIDMCVPETVASYVTPGADVAVFEILYSDADISTGVTPSCSSDHSVSGRNVLANGITAQLVLSKVKVLAVGQSPGPQSSSGTSGSAPAASSSSSGDVLVTFAVNQQDAEQLMVIQQAGIPYLALPGPGA